MGTWDDSKISKARKDYECITPGHAIRKGDLYLRYRWGMYDSSCVCLECATTVRRENTGFGGEVVAGELTWYGGSCRRTHWWVVKDGQVIDPMGDELLRHEEAPGREEIHRDRRVFENILPDYERWRVA